MEEEKEMTGKRRKQSGLGRQQQSRSGGRGWAATEDAKSDGRPRRRPHPGSGANKRKRKKKVKDPDYWAQSALRVVGGRSLSGSPDSLQMFNLEHRSSPRKIMFG